MAFVALVDHHGGDTGQLGIALQPLHEQPGRHDLDPRVRAPPTRSPRIA